MNRVFSLGELAIARYPSGYYEYKDDIVVITEELHIRTCRHRFDENDLTRAYFYGIRFSDGVTSYAEPHQLKKLSDDDNQKIIELARGDRKKAVRSNRVCISYRDGSSEVIEDFTKPKKSKNS